MATGSEVIRSRTNPLIKLVGAVQAGSERGLLALEGRRLLGDATRAGWALEVLLVSDDAGELPAELVGSAAVVRRVDDRLLNSVSHLDTPPGLLALARVPEQRPVETLELPANALVLVISGVADPGNLGALARSAEAAGANAIVTIAGGARPFGPKAMRGSMGSLLRLSVSFAETAEAAASALAERGMRQVIARTRGGIELREFDWSGAHALWVASETGELPDVCSDFDGVTIPMSGAVESLNVAVAGSLLLFAAGDRRYERGDGQV